ncbi:NADH-quinone oxidoreductase subunit H [Acetobacteraceae bacterium H6797]|nr:NADH-quinone oxidoreductase subunit H [Acetobacteraceae bacterium H6797]
MTPLAGLLTQLLHLALMLLAAPLLVGLIRKVKARLLGRQGADILQPWRDILKLLKKRPLLAENASAISQGGPYLALTATLAAIALVPSFAHGMIFAPAGDLLVIGGLLAMARVMIALVGHDVGTGFGGLGAGREMSFAALAEPALLLSTMAFAILTGSANPDAISGALQEGSFGLRVTLGLALLSMLAVAIAENARMPVDNPSTHLELTMVHEAMLLESSGRHLALWEMQAALKLLLWLTLIGTLFFPYLMAPAGIAPVGWVIGILGWSVKTALLAFALAVMETGMAKMRVFRVPEFLGAAVLLALLGAIFLFVSTGTV